MAAVLEAEPIAQVSPEIPPFPVYRFSVEQYHRMVESGILEEEDVRTELLEGWIVPKISKNPAHDTIITLIQVLLQPFLPAEFHTRSQAASEMLVSEPEPDITVVRGEILDYLQRHPGPDDIELAVEVSESSLSRDRWKSRIYARSGIPVYWIVNLVDNQIEVHSQPSGPADEPAYGNVEVFAGDQRIAIIIEGNELGGVEARAMLP